MIIRARYIYNPEGETIADGAVEIRDGLIVRTGTAAEIGSNGEVTDLGDAILMPGLINAHCHLDYTLFRNAIDPQHSFADWIRRINAIKATVTDDYYIDSIRRGFAELMMWGTTTVLNIEAFPELMPRLEPPPIRTWWFWELMDIRNRVENEALTEGALRFFDHHPDWLGGSGLSPHSPYTASIPLYRMAAECARKLEMPVTTHLGESRDEFLMFFKASGTLFEFLRAIGRNMGDCGGRTPLAHLLQNRALPENAIVAHLNELTESDYDLIRETPEAQSMHVVHCPLSHRYFGHREFPYEKLREAGVNVCLGTDSLASNHTLNMFEEMREFRTKFPNVPAEEILSMVTMRAAAALRLEKKLGCLSPGAHADLISIPFAGKESQIPEAIIEHTAPIEWMLVAGRTPSHPQFAASSSSSRGV